MSKQHVPRRPRLLDSWIEMGMSLYSQFMAGARGGGAPSGDLRVCALVSKEGFLQERNVPRTRRPPAALDGPCNFGRLLLWGCLIRKLRARVARVQVRNSWHLPDGYSSPRLTWNSTLPQVKHVFVNIIINNETSDVLERKTQSEAVLPS